MSPFLRYSNAKPAFLNSDRASPAWTTNLLDLYIGTIDVFAKYDNVLGYIVGNEVFVASNATAPATFVKAAARDVKAYLYVTFSRVLTKGRIKLSPAGN